MTTTSERATTGVLNELIIACNDDVRAHDAAAHTVSGERRHRLEDAVQARGTFIAELSQLVRDQGGSPASGGTFFENARGSLTAMRVLIVGDHSGDRYATCARVEDRTLKLYDRALETKLPDAVRTIVARQQVQIASDDSEWRVRRYL